LFVNCLGRVICPSYTLPLADTVLMLVMPRSKKATLHVCLCLLAACLAVRMLDSSSGNDLCKVMDCANAETLGAGSFGRVVGVQVCNGNGKPMAVKIGANLIAEFEALVELSWLRIPDDVPESTENLNLWAVEGTHLNPYILTPLVFDMVKVGSTQSPAIAMELADSSLLEMIYLKKWGELELALLGPSPSEETAKAWTLFHILQGVKHMKSKDYIHRDLKPENIMFVKSVPKIGDLGLACKKEESCRGSAGTPLYMPPEALGLINGIVTHDYKNDMWSVGIIVFEMLFKRIPKKGSAVMKDDFCLAKWPWEEARNNDPQQNPQASLSAQAIIDDAQARIDDLIDAESVGQEWKLLLRGLLKYDIAKRHDVDTAIEAVQALLQALGNQNRITPLAEEELQGMPSSASCDETSDGFASSDQGSSANGSNVAQSSSQADAAFKSAYSNSWASARFGIAMEPSLHHSLVSPVLSAH